MVRSVPFIAPPPSCPECGKPMKTFAVWPVAGAERIIFTCLDGHKLTRTISHKGRTPFDDPTDLTR